MSAKTSIGDMRNLIKRRIVVGSVVFGLWLLGCVTLFAHDGCSPDSPGVSGGIAITAVWIAYTVKNARLIKDEDRMRQAAIARNDERNVLITYKATRLTFVVVMIVGAISTMVLSYLGNDAASEAVGLIVCAVLLIYLVCWFAVSRRA